MKNYFRKKKKWHPRKVTYKVISLVDLDYKNKTLMYIRVPLEKSTTLPLLLLKDYVPLRSKRAMIS